MQQLLSQDELDLRRQELFLQMAQVIRDYIVNLQKQLLFVQSKLQNSQQIESSESIDSLTTSCAIGCLSFADPSSSLTSELSGINFR